MIFRDSGHPAKDIFQRIQDHGFHVLVVGGAVRDMLLGRPFHDIDLLTDARPEQIYEIFAGQKVKFVGKKFSVCLVDGVEVASCRSESDSRNKKNWFIADLSMRDFTINSMGFDPVSGKILDPFHGKEDAEQGIIRFVGDPFDRIAEDPVRMIRACRFAAMMEGRIEDNSHAAIVEKFRQISDNVPGERIRLELIKAMSLKMPSVFFRFMLETGLLEQVLPCIARCRDLDGGPYHGETVLEHCLLSGDALPASQPLLRLAGYLHDAGKFDACKIHNGSIAFHGHENETANIEQDLQKLRFSLEEQEYILSRIRMHMGSVTEKSTPRAVRRLLSRLDKHHVDYRDFMKMRIADRKANLAKKPFRISELKIQLAKLGEGLASATGLGVNDLALNGHEIANILGIAPGPEIGRIKEILLEKILDNPQTNCRENLIHVLRENFKNNEKQRLE